MSGELDVLKLVTARLDATGIPYMVTGSMAMNYYAVPRMTRDIDIVVDLSADHAARIVDIFGGDFYVDADAVRAAVDTRGVVNLIHTTLVVKVDLVVRKDTEYRRTELSRRRQIVLEGHPFSIVSPEDLVISKLDWARNTRSEVQLDDGICCDRSAIWTESTSRTGGERLGLGALYREVAR